MRHKFIKKKKIVLHIENYPDATLSKILGPLCGILFDAEMLRRLFSSESSHRQRKYDSGPRENFGISIVPIFSSHQHAYIARCDILMDWTFFGLSSFQFHLTDHGLEIEANIFKLPVVSYSDRFTLSVQPWYANSELSSDYISIGADKSGCYWYVSSCELKMWISLYLARSAKLDVFDASRWITGHTDINHNYYYLKKQVARKESLQPDE